LVALQYLQIGRVANRVRFVVWTMCERMNVFIYYKTLTIDTPLTTLRQLFSKKLSICLVRAVAGVCSRHNKLDVKEKKKVTRGFHRSSFSTRHYSLDDDSTSVSTRLIQVQRKVRGEAASPFLISALDINPQIGTW